MGLITNILGTFNEYFQIAKSGIRLYKDADVGGSTGLKVRNAANDAYVNLRAGKFYDSSANVVFPVDTADAGSVSAGDIFYAADSTKLSRLAAGTDGYFLKMSSGSPAWVDSSAEDLVIKVSVFQFAYDTATYVKGPLPTGAVIYRVVLDVTTIFNGTNETIEVYTSNSAGSATETELLDALDSDVYTAGQYETSNLVTPTSSYLYLKTSITADGSQGAGKVYVFYSIPSTLPSA